MSVKSAAIGIVIPTIGQRPSLIREALRSFRGSKSVFVLIATDSVSRDTGYLREALADLLIEDIPELDLPSKIDRAFRALPESVLYINWLGDDDKIELDALIASARILENDPGTSLVYGDFNYLDERGRVLAENRLGAKVLTLFGWLPQRLGQPATLYRRSHYVEVGGLRRGYTHAFDFDLFLRLKKKGKFQYLGQRMASWRWHSKSLTVSKRGKSAAEASLARLRNSDSGLGVAVKLILEPLVFAATFLAGKLFDQYLRLQIRKHRDQKSPK